MKAYKTYSIDVVTAKRFGDKYPGKASSKIESLMNADLEITGEELNEAVITNQIEKQLEVLDKEKVLLENLKQRKESILIAKQQKEDQMKLDREKLEQEDRLALMTIKQYDWEFDFNYVHEVCPKIMPAKYVKIRIDNPEMNTTDIIKKYKE